jgi:polar amino acid transport system substrate-binding protein
MKKVAVVFMALLLVSSWIWAADTKSNLAIVVATDPTNPPMQTLDSSRQIVGFDIDVMNAAAKGSGFEAKFISVEWDTIFSGLLVDKYDAIMSSLTITSERMKTMDFSVPYLVVGQVLVIRSGAKRVSSFTDLAGKVVGVLSGSASETELSKAAKTNRISIKTYSDLSPMFPDLVNSRIDAFFCDDYYASEAILSQDPMYKGKMKIAGPALVQESFGVAVRKGNGKVLDAINLGLKKILASEECVVIKKKWLK